MPQRHHARIMQSHLPGGAEQHPDRIMVPWHYKSLPPPTGISTGLFIFAWHAQHRPQNMLLLQRLSANRNMLHLHTYTWLTNNYLHCYPLCSIIQKFFWITRLLFLHAPLGVHSAICRHQPPQRTGPRYTSH